MTVKQQQVSCSFDSFSFPKNKLNQLCCLWTYKWTWQFLFAVANAVVFIFSKRKIAIINQILNEQQQEIRCLIMIYVGYVRDKQETYIGEKEHCTSY